MALRSVLEMVIGSRFKDRGVKDASKSAKKLDTDLRKVAAGFGAVTAAAVGLGIAGKKAFEFGREGAVVTQTADSFDLLMQKAGATGDILEQLRVASQGTVDDMTLMSATATLLAGASGDLATSLAMATPQLLEIAKAANKLNPALGTTTFMYESIATGVKRAQPLILDNLGITIKVGEANQKFATSIGKTVAQLTNEEKSMAILNGTLEAGAVLIDQVGGSTEAAADSYDRITTSLKNWTDALKEEIDDRSAYVDILATNLEMLDKTLRAQQDGIITERERNRIINDVMFTTLTASDALVKLSAKLEANKQAMEAANRVTDGWAVGLSGATEAAGEAADELERARVNLLNLTAAEIGREALESLNKEWEEGKITEDEYFGALEKVGTKLLGFSTEQIAASRALHDLKKDFDDNTLSVRDFITELFLLNAMLNQIPTIDEDFFRTETIPAPSFDPSGEGFIAPPSPVDVTPPPTIFPGIKGPSSISVLVTGNSFAEPVDFEESVENALRGILG